MFVPGLPDRAANGSWTTIARRIISAIAMLVSAAAMPRVFADGSVVADRVMKLTRASPWTLTSTVPITFRTFHPQGMVKIGDSLFVSSVEVQEAAERRASDGERIGPGTGIGHLFKLDMTGRLLADLHLGEGAIYHPGGIDFDGTNIWVPVAEYRPDSRSIVYRVDPARLTATEAFRFDDHLGAIVHNTDDDALHGVSWGSRRFYKWTLDRAGRVSSAGNRASALTANNPSHYIDYQDCKYVGARRMLCGGVAELRTTPTAPPFRLGGLELIDLAASRPIHQVPILLWTDTGLDMTHNPMWIEATATGLRAYFMPEDDRSRLFIYDVATR